MNFEAKENGFVAHFPYGDLHVSGDEAYGFCPYQLLVSSIAVCSGSLLRSVLGKMRMPCSAMKITADVTRNAAKANRVEKIHLHFILTGENMKKDRVQKAVEAASRNCPMVQSVQGSIVVTESFELVP
ncbi:OsmC family protein [Brevibacillus sp. SAFN-007a]|uniref:OsmC family protein n=1 Tax=Brevibacillus sp. SAFN-007a TaxID=3436862 RepID=UPI003F801EB1